MNGSQRVKRRNWAKQWAADVKEILTSAGAKHYLVAKRMGVPTSTLSMYLNHKRTVSVEYARKINAAVSAQIGRPNVKAYLEAIVAPHSDRPNDLLEVMEGSGGAINAVRSYFRKSMNGESALFELLYPVLTEVKDQVNLAFDLNSVWRRSLIRELQGKALPKNRLMIDEITAVFLRHGVDIKPLLRPDSEVRRYRALEELDIVIRESLARATDNNALRLELEADISLAVTDLVIAYCDYIGDVADMFGDFADVKKASRI